MGITPFSIILPTLFSGIGKMQCPSDKFKRWPILPRRTLQPQLQHDYRKWVILFFSFLVLMVSFSFITLLAYFTFLVSLKSRCYFILKLRDPNFKNNFKSPISGSILKDYNVYIGIHKSLIHRVIRKLSFRDYFILYFVIGHLSFSDATSLLTVLDNTMLSHINVE